MRSKYIALAVCLIASMIAAPCADAQNNNHHKYLRPASHHHLRTPAAVQAGKADGPFQIKAQSAILMNMKDGRILYTLNPDKPIQPASLTKVLSLFLVYEALNRGTAHMNDMVTVSRTAWQTGGSRMGLRANKQIPLEELMKGMAIVSGNDASVAVAEHFGGVDEFVRRMNLKAKELGMAHSVFVNPDGLPAKGQVTTARDILMLSCQYINKFPQALDIHSMRYFTFGRTTRANHNRLLIKYDDMDGLKTGFVCEAGYHIIATAKHGDTRLIAVIMGSRTPYIRNRDTRLLIEQGFKMVKQGGSDDHDAHAALRPNVSADTSS